MCCRDPADATPPPPGLRWRGVISSRHYAGESRYPSLSRASRRTNGPRLSPGWCHVYRQGRESQCCPRPPCYDTCSAVQRVWFSPLRRNGISPHISVWPNQLLECAAFAAYMANCRLSMCPLRLRSTTSVSCLQGSRNFSEPEISTTRGVNIGNEGPALTHCAFRATATPGPGTRTRTSNGLARR